MAFAAAPTATVRAWGQVAAAIALVADGHYPAVTVAGISDAARLAAALRQDADQCGVDLILEPRADGVTHDVVARRR